MTRRNPEKTVPWLLMTLVVAVLVAAWVELYLVNVSLIQSGAISQVDRNDVLNKEIVDYSGLLAALIVIAGVLYRTWKKSVPLLIQEISQALRRPQSAASGGEGQAKPRRGGGWRTLLSAVFKEVLLLGRMGECEDFQQWLGHFLIMWGFLGLAVTTALDAIVNFAATPLPITHPVRLLGNFSGIVFMAGLTLAISRRAFQREVRSSSRLGDWVFLLSLFGTAATGFLVQGFADTSNLIGTWVSYPIHLAFISFLLISAPWTKFVHALWRPSWIVYTRLSAQGGR